MSLWVHVEFSASMPFGFMASVFCLVYNVYVITMCKLFRALAQPVCGNLAI
jgi:hypothetical protein